MITIEWIEIQDLRGIRDLRLELNSHSFAICGPNGSGKSGVVDAIEFALTGDISRLKGRGTQGLSLQKHGSHILAQENIESAVATLGVKLTKPNCEVTISRSVKRPEEPLLIPDTKEIRDVLHQLSQHPEVVLSRREVIKFILTEASERSKGIQALLRLEGIEETRGALKSAQNKIKTQNRNHQKRKDDEGQLLCEHLDLNEYIEESAVEICNRSREALGLPPLDALNPDTRIDAGIEMDKSTSQISKSAAISDIKSLISFMVDPEVAVGHVTTVVDICNRIMADISILADMQKLPFWMQGLDLVDSETCPLCDVTWESRSALESHLKEKIARLEAVQVMQRELQDAAAGIVTDTESLASRISAVVKVAKVQGFDSLSKTLDEWVKSLTVFAKGLEKVEFALAVVDRLSSDWRATPPGLDESLEDLKEKVSAWPEQDSLVEAQSFLVRAQERFVRFMDANTACANVAYAMSAANITYDTYCEEASNALQRLYDEVETDFSRFYRQLNSDDESEFKARFLPDEGKLNLEVDFHGQGLFPPSAYHSEGHQDALGVCLYLSLMKHLLGDQFKLAVLDDVVMSVDSGHRKQFCNLLLTHFPNTQFIITTHDKVWAAQMRHSGLIGSKSSAEFHSWTVQTGPIVEANEEVLEEVAKHVNANKIPPAASLLRRHLEFVMADLAHELRAKIPFRQDADYDLGDLFSSVVGQQGEWIKRAIGVAESWNNEEDTRNLTGLKKARSSAIQRYNDENWIVNKVVHYNEWATFDRADLRELLVAVEDLLKLFKCESCMGWMYVSGPKVEPEALRCRCNAISYNLLKKVQT